ncbi:MAG: thiamine-phosphate synthase family protein [Halobacteriales archaeon]
MALVLPSELVVERVLPTLRAMLAAELSERGLTQEEIATHLGVTQAAVSGYVSDPDTVEERIREHPRTRETVEHVAEGLAAGDLDGYDALAAVLELIEDLEDRGPVCELHEEEMPALRGLGCDLCVRGGDPDVRAERETLADARRAARTLATAPGAAEAIPNVGTNVGAALPDADDLADVAAIPGRIYAVGGRVEVPANPEFGASEHVARTLLAARDADPSVGGALNLATDDALLSAAREAGIDPLEFDADYEDRADHLRGRFAERGGVPRVLYHRGAFGIEPVTYVLGESAVAAAERAADLLGRAQGAAR